jgi:hypothetical protein
MMRKYRGFFNSEREMDMILNSLNILKTITVVSLKDI